MPGEHNSILQDKLLNEMRQKKASVTIFLVNGVKLQGTIVAFDMYSILLQREHMTQLIFKHAISTIMPLTPLSLRITKSSDSPPKNEEEQPSIS